MKTVLLFLLVLTACTGLSTEQPQRPRGAGPQDIPSFVQRLDSLRDAADIPGLSVAVVKDQAVVLAVGLGGYADLEHRSSSWRTVKGVWWDNPLDRAEVRRSEFAQAFLQAFVEGVKP